MKRRIIQPRLQLLTFCGLLFCFLLTTGFTFKPDEGTEKVVWPLPPDPPKITYVTSFTERKDMGIKKGFFQKLKEWVVGKEDEPRVLRPTGVFSDGNGTVYVTDTGLQAVHVFDFAEKKYRQVFRLNPDGEGPVRLLSPIGVAVDGQGFLYVSDSLLKQVFVFDPEGKLVETLGKDGEFQRPTGLALDTARNKLYVVDTLGNQVTAFEVKPGTATGKKRSKAPPVITRAFTFGARGTGPGELNFPTHVTLDGEGDIYVTDTLNFRVQRFDSGGKVLGEFGKVGNVLGTFSKPKGVGVDGGGHVYVVDNLYDTIQIFDREGALLLHFGGHGGGPGGFWLPVGLHVDKDRYIFVADTFNQRVQVFRYLGE